MGYFLPISINWVFFPLSSGHLPWFSIQNFKLPIFLESGNLKSGYLEIPGNWLFLANVNILAIFPTQFRSLTLIFNSEFQISNFSDIWKFEIWKSENSQILASFQFPDSRKIGNLKIWVENQGQWPKLNGENSQYIEIGQN